MLPSSAANSNSRAATVGDDLVRGQGTRTFGRCCRGIVITWDEDDYADQGQTGTGCCGFDPGGGHVVTMVITNNDDHHRSITDSTPYNHYSLLRTIEAAFRLPYLAHAGDAGVTTMTPLFANH